MTTYSSERIRQQRLNESPFTDHDHESEAMIAHNREHAKVEALLMGRQITEEDAITLLNNGSMRLLKASDQRFDQSNSVPVVSGGLAHTHEPMVIRTMQVVVRTWR